MVWALSSLIEKITKDPGNANRVNVETRNDELKFLPENKNLSDSTIKETKHPPLDLSVTLENIIGAPRDALGYLNLQSWYLGSLGTSKQVTKLALPHFAQIGSDLIPLCSPAFASFSLYFIYALRRG